MSKTSMAINIEPSEQLTNIRIKSEDLKVNLSNACALLEIGTVADFSDVEHDIICNYFESLFIFVEQAKNLAEELAAYLYGE